MDHDSEKKMPVLKWELDQEGCFARANPAFIRSACVSKDVTGRHLSECLSPQCAEAIDVLSKEAAQSGETRFDTLSIIDHGKFIRKRNGVETLTIGVQKGLLITTIEEDRLICQLLHK